MARVLLTVSNVELYIGTVRHLAEVNEVRQRVGSIATFE
jgi:hypothetical protein